MLEQWLVDRAAQRANVRLPTLFEVQHAQRLAAPPPPPTEAEQVRAVIAAEINKVRAEALDAGVRAGLATARAMERIRR